jgi:DNA mismatch endonuclease (patch repair protein)
MLSNRRTDTSIEKLLRAALHREGLRFRKDYPIRPGRGRTVRVDVAFPRAKVAIFVDGCFWHSCPIHRSSPKANADYWIPKLVENVERDRRVERELAEQGWRVVRIWEHEDPADAAARVHDVIRS